MKVSLELCQWMTQNNPNPENIIKVLKQIPVEWKVFSKYSSKNWAFWSRHSRLKVP
jgi:hypothetical protein